MGKNEMDIAREYLNKKYFDILKEQKNYEVCEETVVPGMIYQYRFYIKVETNGKNTTSIDFQ